MLADVSVNGAGEHDDKPQALSDRAEGFLAGPEDSTDGDVFRGLE